MRNLLIALIAAALTALAPAAFAQVSSAVVVTACGSQSYTVGQPAALTQDATGKQCGSASGSGGTFTTSPTGYTSTETGGSVTTSGTFQSALAANAGRHSCTIQNTSTDILYVFFGATGSATTSNSFALAAATVTGGSGGVVSCSIGGIVLTDNVAITSKTTNGATFVVASQ